MSEFKGSTYESTLDLDRLSNNLQRVYVVMSDGQWHTHEDLEKVGISPDGPDALASDQLRGDR